MKALAIIPVLFFSISLKAQIWHFNTETSKDSVIKVYDGKNLIAQYIIDPAAKGKMILTGFFQQKDPVGKYVTIYYFSSSDNLPLTNIHFAAKFNAPVLNATYWNGVKIGNPDEVLNSEKTEYHLTTNEIQTNTFKLMVFASESVITTFQGIDSVSR